MATVSNDDRTAMMMVMDKLAFVSLNCISIFHIVFRIFILFFFRRSLQFFSFANFPFWYSSVHLPSSVARGTETSDIPAQRLTNSRIEPLFCRSRCFGRRREISAVGARCTDSANVVIVKRLCGWVCGRLYIRHSPARVCEKWKSWYANDIYALTMKLRQKK